MGISSPKLPKINLFSSNAESSASGLANVSRKPRVKKQPIEIVPPPKWVEQIDGYSVSSCAWHDSGRFGGCFVVKYDPRSFSGDWDWGFVKIYAAGGMNEPPFVQIKGIWKELHADKRAHNMTYDITEDGKIYNDLGDFPSENDVKAAIYDIGSIYDDWKDFPNVPDWDTVRKLHEAQMAVESLWVEEKYGYGQKNIDNLRKKITEIQTEIAQAEKNLNEMYEKAADGMNLLEEHGIAVNLDDEEPKEPEKIAVDYDIASMYPTGPLSFIGEATIVRMNDGSCVVTPKPLKHHPNDGDMVVDRSNGKIAVYTYGKWEVVNP